MNQGFVPLSLSARAPAPNAAGQAKVATEPPASPPFRPLACAAASPPLAPAAGGEPVVTLQRDGAHITRIRVQCCCGQVIELACEEARSGPGELDRASASERLEGSLAATPAPKTT